MHSICPPRHEQPPALHVDDVGTSDGAGQILVGVLETLEEAGVSYCLQHGYENYPQHIKSDVDCIISGTLRPEEVVALLHEQRARIGAEVVRWEGYYIVLAGRNADGSICILELDMSVAFEYDDLPFYSGTELLQSRRKHRQFWVPTADLEFGCYLIKKIAKGRLDEEQGRQLSALYQQDPIGCQEQVSRFWSDGSTTLIVAAANSGNWGPVSHVIDQLGTELRRRAALRHPLRALTGKLSWLARSAKKVWRADAGFHVVFLGPDGAGKSSVVQGVKSKLGSIFPRTQSYRFPPSLLSRAMRRPEPPPEKRPHGSPPRSFLHSVIRAVCYWFPYYVPGYPATVRLDLARGTLVLHDRHLIDALVDPMRYRYGGPEWLLRLICRLAPKPDMVVLLDAPAEVLHSRKQEVPLEETARQRDAYRALVGSLKNGYVADASRPREAVAGNVCDNLLRHLSTRVERRLARKGVV